jgi:hypothetical protein
LLCSERHFSADDESVRQAGFVPNAVKLVGIARPACKRVRRNRAGDYPDTGAFSQSQEIRRIIVYKARLA